MRLIKETHIQFTKYHNLFMTASGIFLALSLISIFLVRGLNYGLDFTGGTLLQVSFEKPITTAAVRQALATNNLENSNIQMTGVANEFIIRTPLHASSDSTVVLMTKALESVPDNSFITQRAESVGPKIGKELRATVFQAIFWAMVVILVYISFRFQFKFALGAVAALVHDVIFTLGIFSLFQLEISLSTIAAFLTIVGYSLNDTIVIFDRVRENMKSKRYNVIEQLFDVSINESLSRTVITSATTLFVVLILAFAHGEVKIFSIALIIGIVIGTYSSLYVASPIVIMYQKKLDARKKK
ncbi:MAG: protein translocase subunit SecF [Candidatus Neomarinimicrobiota bacterium]|jgi:preprotein translocase subunit SecF